MQALNCASPGYGFIRALMLTNGVTQVTVNSQDNYDLGPQRR